MEVHSISDNIFTSFRRWPTEGDSSMADLSLFSSTDPSVFKVASLACFRLLLNSLKSIPVTSFTRLCIVSLLQGCSRQISIPCNNVFPQAFCQPTSNHYQILTNNKTWNNSSQIVWCIIEARHQDLVFNSKLPMNSKSTASDNFLCHVHHALVVWKCFIHLRSG